MTTRCWHPNESLSLRGKTLNCDGCGKRWPVKERQPWVQPPPADPVLTITRSVDFDPYGQGMPLPASQP